MSAALQNVNGPDEAATSVQAGVQTEASRKDQKMNERTNSTGMASSPAPTLAPGKILDIEDMIGVIQHLNEAIFMAAGSLSNRAEMSAIQTVADEIENKLLITLDRLQEVREELA